MKGSVEPAKEIICLETKMLFFILGNVCADIDECLSGTHDCLTPDIETCYNTIGAYFCESQNSEGNEGECQGDPRLIT